MAKMNKKSVTTAISLDVEKAFDAIWQQGLLYKIANLNLPQCFYRTLSSFLTERQIKVRSENHLSRTVWLNAGTPQGSVLSPVLYLLYVNDAPLDDLKCRAGQFADDASTWTTSTSIARNYINLQK